jgi:hypothetical protein
MLQAELRPFIFEIVQLDSGEASDLEPAADPNNLSIHLH